MSEQNKKLNLKVLGESPDKDFNTSKGLGFDNPTKLKQNKNKIKINTNKLNNIKVATKNDEEEIVEESIEETITIEEPDISGIDVINDCDYIEKDETTQEQSETQNNQTYQIEDDTTDNIENDIVGATFEESNIEDEVMLNEQSEMRNQVSFTESLKNLFKNIFKFKGKTDKKEYLFSWVWLLIINLGLPTLISVLSMIIPFAFLIIPVVTLATTIASASLNCRRFNDMGMYWWTGILPLALGFISFVLIAIIKAGIILTSLSSGDTIALAGNFGNSLLFIIIGTIMLSIESIWQFILFICKDSNSFKNKTVNYILIGLMIVGTIVTLVPFII